MNIYRLRIYPRSSHITPWQSDTLLGSLCWILRENYGEVGLTDLIGKYKGNEYPFVVSDCFPGDYLPKPLAGNVFKREERVTKKASLDTAEKSKNAKRAELIALNDFNTIISGGTTEIMPKKNSKKEAAIMHNQLSRLSDTAADGSLFEEQEIFWDEPYLTVYAGIEDSYEPLFYYLIKQLSLKGFGKRISAGKGAFSIGPLESFDGFANIESPNSVVMLSNYIPCRHESTEGQYKSFVKYGKLGQELSFSDNPFKKPLMMIRPGAVFWTSKPANAYGRVVNNISQSFPEAVQFGCSLACPAKIEKPEIN